LRHQRQSAAHDGACRFAGNQRAVKDGAAGCRRDKADDGFDGGCFTRAVGAEERNCATFRQSEIQIVDRNDRSVGHAQSSNLKRHAAPCPSPK
jgi:hypothetical protein